MWGVSRISLPVTNDDSWSFGKLQLTYDDYLVTTNMARMKVHVVFNEAGDEEITVVIAFLHADSAMVAKTFISDFIGKNLGF